MTRMIPARAAGLIARRIGDEYVVVDEATGTAHQLERAAAAVWDVAGTRQRPHGLTDAEIEGAVVDLTDLGLLRDNGVSRRTMLKRSGAVAVGVGITTVRLPAAAAANSKNPHGSLSTTSGPKGTVVGVSGSEFAPNSPIFITVNGVTATLSSPGAQTDASGNIPAGLTFIVPDTGANVGAQPVIVQVNGVSTSFGNFNITTPTVTMSKTVFNKNQSGQTFTLSGSGFGPNAVVSITAPAGWTRTPTSVTASASGVISPTTITVSTPPGNSSGSFVYTDQYGNTVSVPVTAN